MSGVFGDFMREVNSYQHGKFLVAVFEINSPAGGRLLLRLGIAGRPLYRGMQSDARPS